MSIGLGFNLSLKGVSGSYSLVLTEPPEGAFTSTPFIVTAEIRNSSGQLANGVLVTVSRNVVSGGPGPLIGTTSVVSDDGILAWTLQQDDSGVYTLTFSSPGMASVTSGEYPIDPL